MEIKKGDEFLEIKTGLIYRIYATSKHGTQVVVASKYEDNDDFVVHMNPERIESIEKYIRDKAWVSYTPAAKALYASKTR